MTAGRSPVLAYRQAALTDASGRILAYVDRLAIHPAPSGGGTVGMGGIAFAPRALERLSGRGIRAGILSRGVRRATLQGLRLSLHAGEQRSPDGGWHCEAAIGTFRTLATAARRRSRHPRRRLRGRPSKRIPSGHSTR